MPTVTQSWRKALLTRILDTHERSVSFGRSASWPRDVIVKIDAKTFPEAFAPEGRPIRGMLLAAASELEAAGCVRVVRQARGHLRGEIEEIRVGPAEITRTYEVAQALGYEPLSSVVTGVEQHAVTLATEPQPAWMRTFLIELAAALRRDGRVSLTKDVCTQKAPRSYAIF